MRAFIILCCFIAAASAQAGGYDYERQNGGGGGGGASAGGFEQHGAQQLSQPIQQVAEYNKEFYSYTAPEADFEQGHNDNQLADSLKKSLRVVFIRGPENNGLEKAALQLAKSATDDRTAIYVLTKQSDTSDLANKLNTLNHQSANKPEVHFVKYRTQADAENAQRTIQAQYDALGGRSSSHNGGVAPVLNFASQAPARVSHGGSTGSLGGSTGGFGGSAGAAVGAGADANGYLPPNRRV